MIKAAKLCVLPTAWFAILAATWFVADSVQDEPKQEVINPVPRSEIAQVGIDAGINACLTSGKMRPQMSEQELNILKLRARKLMDVLYPEQKFEWPELKERGIVGRVPEA